MKKSAQEFLGSKLYNEINNISPTIIAELLDRIESEPSDEEIDRSSCPELEKEKAGWKRGVKWLKEQIASHSMKRQ